MFGLSELALILVVVAVVLAVKRLPELTRSAGKAARILKSEARAMKEQDAAPAAAAPADRVVVQGTVVDRDTPSPRS
ncbi:twin-arginine translocase TatA/TatE family subunit [Streptomyces minutiscleroticus]|uniref:Translocase n=1 Tax=Streptomyces minutiscleroticus TaxID=68238 RepID=A0A918NRM6_9ACTN|nr:twin-arginine translocase TatA/TatE family subunit [Streptomyces minutiscleroticus]GGX90542.1 translocase [Streptomyces minutiscleroticus]